LYYNNNNRMTDVQKEEKRLTSSRQNHDTGVWLHLKKMDLFTKYSEVAVLVGALVVHRVDTEWSDEKYFWRVIAVTLLLNVFMQSFHIFLYYGVNGCLTDDRFYWPRVFPLEWNGNNNEWSGYSYHFKFFYVLKALILSYLGFIIFQEKLDAFFVYPIYALTILLIIFDLCIYIFNIN